MVFTAKGNSLLLTAMDYAICKNDCDKNSSLLLNVSPVVYENYIIHTHTCIGTCGTRPKFH